MKAICTAALLKCVFGNKKYSTDVTLLYGGGVTFGNTILRHACIAFWFISV